MQVDAQLEPSVPPPAPPSNDPRPEDTPQVAAVDDSWLHDIDANAGLHEQPESVAAIAAAEPHDRRGIWARVLNRPSKDATQRMHSGAVPVRAERDATPSRKKATNPWVLRSIGVCGFIGILALGYLQYWPKHLPAMDLLGTSLPESGDVVPQPSFDVAEFDPRLADTSPLPFAQPEPATTAGTQQAATAAEFDPEAVMRQSAADAAADASIQRNDGAQSPGLEPVAAAPVGIAAAPVAPAPTVAPGLAVADPQVLERMQRMEEMMLMLSQQLADLKKANAQGGVQAAAPAAAPAVAPAAAPQSPAQVAPPAEVPAPRPAPKRVMVKAKPPAHREAPKVATAKPAREKAAPTGAQLVSVDMWNGEPSVVVASGIPGDRRVRVLRPGDVVNGLSLKSADPVSRTATFVAPGSQGLTLSVSNGG